MWRSLRWRKDKIPSPPEFVFSVAAFFPSIFKQPMLRKPAGPIKNLMFFGYHRSSILNTHFLKITRMPWTEALAQVECITQPPRGQENCSVKALWKAFVNISLGANNLVKCSAQTSEFSTFHVSTAPACTNALSTGKEILSRTGGKAVIEENIMGCFHLPGSRHRRCATPVELLLGIAESSSQCHTAEGSLLSLHVSLPRLVQCRVEAMLWSCQISL